MPNDLKKQYFDANWPLELYKLTAFTSSTFLWLSLFYFDPNFFSKAHFVTALLVGNFFIYHRTYGFSFYLNKKDFYLYYFIFQMMCLIGVSFTHRSPDFLYMVVLPTMMAVYHKTIIKKELSLNKDFSLYAYSSIFGLLLIVEGYRKGSIYTEVEAISLSTFFLWSFSTLVFGFYIYQKDSKVLLKRMLKKSSKIDLNSNKNDRMFFHDFINHTHSLLLYLRAKKDNESLSGDEVQNLIHEIKLMQETLYQHFGFTHKNIVSNGQFVSFHMAMARVYQLIDAFFINNENVEIKFLGAIKDNNSLEKLRECTVDFIAFHRVITNLLKNAHEAGSDEIECIFDYQDNGLYFTVSNNLKRFDQEKMNLDRDLGIHILKSHRKSSDHLGLESISRLCEDAGGTFEFNLGSGRWVSICFLPKESFIDSSLDNAA